MQMHFLNTKLLEEKCANCTCSFDKKNLRATKLKVSREKSSTQEMEIQILDALAFIYETSRNEFANTLAHFIEDEENEAILPTTAETLTVALCCQCAPILAEMYNCHRSFNKLSKSDSIISKVKSFQGRQTMKTDTPVTFSETEEFGENLFDDLTYDDNQTLCSEIENNLGFRYEQYDVLSDFSQLLPVTQNQPNLDATSEELKTEKSTPVPVSLSKGFLPLTLAISKSADDSITERKRYSGGAKIGLHPDSQLGSGMPATISNGRITRRMTRELEKQDNQVEEKKVPVPAAASTTSSTVTCIGLDDSVNEMSFDFKMESQNAVGEIESIVLTEESNEVSNIDNDLPPSNESPSPKSPSLHIDDHSTINIEQLVELSGLQQLRKESLNNGSIGIENGLSIKGKDDKNSKVQSGGRVPCTVCGQKICADNMRGHMKIHAPVRETFKCELCEKVYLHKRNLRVHMKCHSQGEEVNCQYCNKLYPTVLLLKCHEEIHHGEEKPYTCEFCHLKFRKKRELETHAPVHSTERPFNCSECGNNFKRKKDLRRHERIHSDARLDKESFKCKDCGKLLLHSFSLYKHRVKYHRPQQ